MVASTGDFVPFHLSWTGPENLNTQRAMMSECFFLPSFQSALIPGLIVFWLMDALVKTKAGSGT